jgi:hypothetical protein
MFLLAKSMNYLYLYVTVESISLLGSSLPGKGVLVWERRHEEGRDLAQICVAGGRQAAKGLGYCGDCVAHVTVDSSI